MEVLWLGKGLGIQLLTLDKATLALDMVKSLESQIMNEE